MNKSGTCRESIEKSGPGQGKLSRVRDGINVGERSGQSRKKTKQKKIITGYVTLGRNWVLWNHSLFGLGSGLF